MIRAAVRLIAAITLATLLAACSNQACSYYGLADASTPCVVVGPAPTGGYH
jgi:hypothetical protein